jgi:putative PIN family toxin of toxin-antitoxin system
MIVVIDTNVLISSLLGSVSPPAQLFDLWRKGQFQLALSESVLAEYRRVLLYPHILPYHRLSESQIESRLDQLRMGAVMVTGDTLLTVVKHDPSDNKFLACALEARADLVVSGDKRHLLPLRSFSGIPIVSVVEGIRLIQEISLRAA